MRVNKKAVIVSVIAVIVLMLILVITGSATDSQFQHDKNVAHEIAELIRSYGYDENNPVIKAASAWWWQIDHEEKVAAQRVTEPEIEGAVVVEDWKKAEYPVASRVWEFLRNDMGLSEAVSAGLLGSMMQECGGCTLNLQWDLTAGSGTYTYRGLHMWSLYYCPEIATADLEGQLQYLKDTLEKNITYFGGDYNFMISLTSPPAVASYEYTWYGRGRGVCPQTRKDCAWIAYDYFAYGEG